MIERASESRCERQPGQGQSPVRVSLEEFESIFEEVSNWDRWVDPAERGLGTINYAGPQAVRRGLDSVVEARSMGLSRPMPTAPGPSNSRPVAHTYYPPVKFRTDAKTSYTFHKDHIALCPHGGAMTHLDALSHMQWKGRFFGGSKSEDPACGLGVELLASGVLTRGVLLDVPRARETTWLDPDDPWSRVITRADLEAAEARAGVPIEPGDAVLVRTGRWDRVDSMGDWSHSKAQVGLHPGVVPWLAARSVAVLGCDTTHEIYPSVVEGIDFPVHLLALVSMGMPLIDNLDLENVARHATASGRSHFLFVLSALPLLGGTGCPVNPLAVY